MKKKINDPHNFINGLGGLHDARIERFFWFPENDCLEISINDINSNSVGFPDYEGCQPSTISFEDILEVDFSIDLVTSKGSILRIYDFDIYEIGDAILSADLKFSLSGRMKIEFRSFYITEVGTETRTVR